MPLLASNLLWIFSVVHLVMSFVLFGPFYTNIAQIGPGGGLSWGFEEENLGLLEAFHDIKQKHGIALPNLPLWQSLCAYYQEDVPFKRYWHSLSSNKKLTHHRVARQPKLSRLYRTNERSVAETPANHQQ